MTTRWLSVSCMAVTLVWAGSAGAARGGPDRGGYEWADDDETGVTYEWVDIGATPTCVTLGDDAESGVVPVGFTFRFYGADYTEAHIGSNGYVSFKSNVVSSGFAGQCPLPDPGTASSVTPDLAVYGFYQDLNPAETTSGTICYATLGTGTSHRFVVTYDGIDYFQRGPGEPDAWGTEPVTFQIVLYEGTNEAQVNIQESGITAGLPRWESNTSIGLENDDGTMGLGICSWTETDRIPDEYAVRFRRSTSFGVLPPDQIGFGGPGSTATFDFELLNFSSASVAGTVTGVSASGWTVTPPSGTVTAAAGGGSAPFSVDVAVPATATPDVTDALTVSVTAGSIVATATVEIRVTLGDDDWQPIADLPEALTQAEVVAEDGNIYVIGGELLTVEGTTVSRTLVDSTYMWDPALNGWDDCAIAELPYAASLGGACAMNGHIYYVGGLSQFADPDTGAPALFVPGILDYEVASDAWTARTEPEFLVMDPIVTCDPTARKIYVFGGYADVDHNGQIEIPSDDEPTNPDTTVPVFQVYDAATDTWRDDLAAYGEFGLTSAANALIDGRIFYAGGSWQEQDDSTGAWGGYITRAVRVYDIATNTWTDGPMFGQFIDDNPGVVFRDQFCILAGQGSGETPVAFADWWCLSDPNWITQSDPLPVGLVGLDAAVLEDEIYVVSGNTVESEAQVAAQRWPTDDTLPAAIDPVICAADADADADADGGDVASDADATGDGRADVVADADGGADTAGDGGGTGGDSGCGCRVADGGGAGSFVSALLLLGLAWTVRRRRS